MSIDIQRAVHSFMVLSGQIPFNSNNVTNTKLTSLYIGLVLEEVQEMLESQGTGSKELALVERMYKTDQFNLVANEEFLDSLIDIAWVALGAAHALGADVEGAIHAVAQNNMTKFPECPVCDGDGGFETADGHPSEECTNCSGTGRVVLRDANGKIQKPEGYKKLSLAEFLPK